MSTATRRWLRRYIPAGLLSRPDEALIALLCLMSGSGAAAGRADASSVEALLPSPVYRAWGVILLIGGLALLVGIFSMKQAAAGYLIRQPAIYRLGQRLLFTGGLAYAACLLFTVGAPASVAVIVCFSLARGLRLLTLTVEERRHGPD